MKKKVPLDYKMRSGKTYLSVPLHYNYFIPLCSLHLTLLDFVKIFV